MRALSFISTVLCAGLSLVGAATAQTDAFPSKPIRFVSSSAPGGLTDVVGRILGERMSASPELRGQSVVIENRPGAGGVIAAMTVVNAAPDGHSLLIADLSNSAIAPLLMDKPPYDPLRDFAAVSLIGTTRFYLAVNSALGVAVGGTGFLKEHAFTLHLVVECDNEHALAQALARVRDLARNASGIELPDSVPRVMRSRPFGSVRGMLGRDGERWVPIHAVFPLGDAQKVLAANQAFFEAQQPMMDRQGIVYSVMTMTTGHEFFLEPAFYWMDEITPLHVASVGEDIVKPWLNRPANVEARESVARLRRATQELYASLGGVSWQVARDYPFLEILKPETRALLEALKHAVDPKGLMNPGSLGLAQ